MCVCVWLWVCVWLCVVCFFFSVYLYEKKEISFTTDYFLPLLGWEKSSLDYYFLIYVFHKVFCWYLVLFSLYGSFSYYNLFFVSFGYFCWGLMSKFLDCIEKLGHFHAHNFSFPPFFFDLLIVFYYCIEWVFIYHKLLNVRGKIHVLDLNIFEKIFDEQYDPSNS